MSKGNRFYIGKKEQCDLDGTLEEWIDEKIPPPPPETKCECGKDQHQHAHESEPDAEGLVEIIDCSNLAETYLYTIKGDRVCYTYVCEDCAEARSSDDYLCDQDYPITDSGYAITPTRCV